ncbi:MAG: helix-turn-helix transcriptional regulator [Actinobacteria bacterium]|nr:helix-turn-helix transcriptional regulator [Actinomycetota bacterium]
MTETSDRFVAAPRDPTGALVGTIGYETTCAAPRDHRGLPSPFLTFIVTLDAPVVIVAGEDERGLDVVVAGLSTAVEMVKMPRFQSGLQAAVHPLAARRLFGMPAGELARLSLEGEDVLGRAAPLLRERLAEASGWDERFAILTAELGLGTDGRPRRREGDLPARPEVVEAWRLLTATRGRIRIGDLAERVFLSRRRLSTLFVAELGITPKEAARTMRFTHAVTRIGAAVRAGGEAVCGGAGGADARAPAVRSAGPARRRPLDLARIAAECGYADQSHLDREFRAFAGTSPSGWIAEEFPNIQAGGHRYARDWEA